jgi:hypothetical protein
MTDHPLTIGEHTMHRRITVAHLEVIIARINRATGSPMTPYSPGADGRHRANIGAYHLSRQYGGFALHRIANEPGGVSCPLSTGHIPARELADRMLAFLAGLEAAQHRAA